MKVAVNDAATEIAEEYLNEIAPFTRDLDLEAAFMLLPGNVVTAADAEALERRYKRRVRGKAAADTQILDFLYGAGLLGIVTTDHVDGRKSQQFLRPGQQSFDEAVSLPRVSHYLVHPILSQHVSRVNDGYVGSLDRTNVIGDGRPWIDGRSEARLCVMKADIRNFSTIMAGEHEVEVRTLLHDVVQAHAAECPIAEVVDGDSLTIVHESPTTIIKVAKRIMQDLYEGPGNPELRVAIDCGSVELPAGQSRISTGEPFRVAARLEPHVDAGQIWVTERFKDVLDEQPGFYQPVPLREAGRAETVNIKKIGSDEPDESIVVYHIVEKT